MQGKYPLGCRHATKRRQGRQTWRLHLNQKLAKLSSHLFGHFLPSYISTYQNCCLRLPSHSPAWGFILPTPQSPGLQLPGDHPGGHHRHPPPSWCFIFFPLKVLHMHLKKKKKKQLGYDKKGEILTLLAYWNIPLFSFLCIFSCGLLTFYHYIVNIYWPWKLYHKYK